MQDKNSFLWKLVNLDPALLRGLIMAVIWILASIGVAVTPELPNSLIGAIAAILAVVQAIWTRPEVTANARVSVYLPDPVNAPNVVAAGEAVTTATTAAIIDAATTMPRE